ncbi:TPA: hypothetical protein ACH3X2_003586 [Trebouxia sp. C0005]
MLTAVACRLGLSSLVSREQERSKVAEKIVRTGPLLPAAKPYLIDNLSTPQLQTLAAFAGATTLPINQRSTLLNVVNTRVEALACKAWHVENVETVFANRTLGALVSMAGDLWIYGGVSSDVLLHDSITAPHTGADCHLMKLSKHTHQWEPVSPPEGVSRAPSYQAAGVVHRDKLYLPMRPFPNLQGLTDGMRIFEPVRQEWTVLSVNVWPTAWAKQLLAATEDYLVQFGGINVAYDIVNPEEALWTWDINHHTWQQMHPTGDIPAPDAALGLAVANGCAYLLVKEANTQHSHVGVYEVDLQQWHWRKLPLEGHPPRVKQKLVPVVVQNKWLMFAGKDAYPNQAGTGLAIFDFDTLAWSQSDTSGDAFPQRRGGYVATCHDNAMIIMGGMESPKGSANPKDAWPAKGALCIRQQATVPAVDASDLSCSRYDIGADINTIFQEELFPDATVAAQGRVWHVHRAILASASPILKEAFLCGNTTELVFEDITADAMGLLLNWLYARFKASLTLSQAVTLFKLSHRFDIVKLQHQCEQTLKASVAMEAMPQLEDLADSYHCMELKEACQHFRTLLDEDGLKQLDEHLACYAAAQGMQDAICRAQMPAQAGPSCFQPQDQEDVQPCPGSMCHVDGATQTITGDFGQDVVESEKGSRHGDGEIAQETMLVDSQPPTEDDRPAVSIVHGAETPGSPASHKDNEFLDHESPRSVFVTDGYQGLTTCSSSSSSDGSGGAEEISTSDIISPQPSLKLRTSFTKPCGKLCQMLTRHLPAAAPQQLPTARTAQAAHRSQGCSHMVWSMCCLTALCRLMTPQVQRAVGQHARTSWRLQGAVPPQSCSPPPALLRMKCRCCISSQARMLLCCRLRSCPRLRLQPAHLVRP